MQLLWTTLSLMAQAVLGPLGGSNREGPMATFPSLDLILKPHLTGHPDEHEHAKIELQMEFDILDLDAHQPLISMALVRDAVPGQPYDNLTLHIRDSDGPLSASLTETPGTDTVPTRTWLIGRPASGRISLGFTAVPRKVDRYTKIAARTDLRYGSGGMQGVGLTMIPTLEFPGALKTKWKMTVQWNLEAAPSGTRALWSFGEGPEPIHRIGSAHELQNTIYGVGLLKSVTGLGDLSDVFGLYWLGDLPPTIAGFNQYGETMFKAMSKFWKDPWGSENPYRIFVRNAAPAKGYGGSAFLRSYMLEYDETIDNVTEDDLCRLLTHEMVHNWPHMGKTPGEPDEVEAEEDGAWFTEGVADYYAMHLPFKTGLRNEEWTKSSLNMYLSGYFTNPAIRVSNSDARKRAWQDPNGQMMIYSRGFTYLLRVDEQIRQKSNNKFSVDDLIMKLISNEREHQDFSETEWTRLIEEYLGSEGVAEFMDMRNGSVQRPLQTRTDTPFTLVREDREVLEAGFDPSSLSTRVITGLKAGSRAEEAGIREGDRVIDSISFWRMAESFDTMNKMTLQRDGPQGPKNFTVTYWPRTHEKFECYQYV